MQKPLCVIEWQGQMDDAVPMNCVILAPNMAPQISLNQEPKSLAEIIHQKKVIVLLPSHWVSIISVEAPNLSAQQLKQALPFMLEDNLADELSHCHIVPFHKEDAQYKVAIIDKNVLQNTLDYFSALGVEVDMMLPLSMALPIADQQITIWLQDNKIAVRLSPHEGAGFLFQAAQLKEVLQAIANTNVSTNKIIILELQDNTAGLKENRLQEISFSVEHHTLSQTQFLTRLAETLALSLPQCNLLWGDFKKTHENTGFFDKKNRFILAAVSSVILSFFIPLCSYSILSWKLHAVETQIIDVQRKVFPDSKTNLAKTRALFDNELKRLQAKQGHDPCWQLLGKLSLAWTRESLQMSELSCQNAELQSSIDFPNAAALTSFSEKLKQEGLQVHQANTELNGTRVRAQITLSQGTA